MVLSHSKFERQISICTSAAQGEGRWALAFPHPYPVCAVWLFFPNNRTLMMPKLFWDFTDRTVGDTFNWRYFLKCDRVQICSELCNHGQALPGMQKGHLGGWLIHLAPLHWRTVQRSSRHHLTCQLFSLKMYTWWQNQTIKKWTELLDDSDFALACWKLHACSFHIWSVQNLFFF